MDFFAIFSLIGGLGLFLYGMNVMGDNLKKIAGGKLEAILASLTSNKVKGFLLGLIVTAIIQSSSATTVMLVGFVNSGFMQFSQTISIILGANLGTTVTAWIISMEEIGGELSFLEIFKPSTFTPILMIIGVIMTMICKSNKKQSVALILIGFSALMFGMDMMSDALSGLKDSATFGEILIMFSNPIMGILVGTMYTFQAVPLISPPRETASVQALICRSRAEILKFLQAMAMKTDRRLLRAVGADSRAAEAGAVVASAEAENRETVHL